MLDLDRVQFDVDCPNCKFSARIFYRDARLRDVLICRGCKANIQLDDSMNECRKARRRVAAAFAELEGAFAGLNKSFKINF